MGWIRRWIRARKATIRAEAAEKDETNPAVVQAQPTTVATETQKCEHPVELRVKVGGVGEICNQCAAVVSRAGEEPVPIAGRPIDYTRTRGRIGWMR